MTELIATQQPRPLARSGRGNVLHDSWLMTTRLLTQIIRVPDLLVFSIIQPVMFVLLFRYVFGGAINVGGQYVNYLIPGIFVQTLLFNGAATGIGMADDLQKGLVDRFRSLPISRAALLIGRGFSDLLRSTLIFFIMLAVGVLTGFRFSGGVFGAIAGTLLILGFSFAFSWIGILIGLSVKTVEAAQSGGFIWLFPLTFASSAFVRTDSMPHWLQGFANHNPVTVVVNSVRRLYLSAQVADTFKVPSFGGQIAQALGWLVFVLVVFVALSVAKFRRLSR
ncbi:MAG TPA: ABC transporter permease [Jatrophihabitantaceae bacterium]|jgi:ABC transporter DrrB family efflux protein|nr:ABC transporter permease [Jatrophihabitantaceae bacterium]